jgi:hypothetical protein
MKVRCPFCGYRVQARPGSPWPLKRHDTHGRTERDYSNGYAGRVCPGSRAVHPLPLTPWAALALHKENPLHIDIIREVPAISVEPGETIYVDGPLFVDVIEHRLSGTLRLGGYRPGHQRRNFVTVKEGELLRVLPPADDEIKVWQELGKAISRAVAHWDDEQQDLAESSDVPSAPWQVDGDDSIGLWTGNRRFRLVLGGAEPDTDPTPAPTGTDEKPPAAAGDAP